MTDDLTLRMERRFPAPVERIFTAWTDPALLCQWFWPERINPSYDVDLRVGGRFRISSDVVTVSGESRPARITGRCAALITPGS